MSYEPRTIAFGAEILHQPIAIQAETVQGIHNSLYQEQEIGYQNFQVSKDGIHLTNPGQTPGTISMATYLPDRIVIREEYRPCTVEEFATRVVNVGDTSYRSLGVNLSLAQQFWVRTLVNPRHVNDSRKFVAERFLAGGMGSLSPFGRDLHSMGLRYTFLAPEDQEGMFSLRLEPWTQDCRSLWLEVVGQFTRPINSSDLPNLSEHLYSTYEFMTGPSLEFVAQFDQK
ncbi:MAG: hypothetical protein ACYTG5_02915 [Planctomycetota bacterium]|jgi:hypothetical protein